MIYKRFIILSNSIREIQAASDWKPSELYYVEAGAAFSERLRFDLHTQNYDIPESEMFRPKTLVSLGHVMMSPVNFPMIQL